MDKEEIFLSQIKTLRKSIHVGDNELSDTVFRSINFIRQRLEPEQHASHLKSLADTLLCDEVVKNNLLCNSVLPAVLNEYSSVTGLPDTDIWAYVFERLLGDKTGCRHPLVYSDIMNICRKEFNRAGCGAAFPLNTETDLCSVLQDWSGLLCGYLKDSSSYTLMSDANVRNILVKYLISQADQKHNSPLYVLWMYPGTGIEPLLVAYTISLLTEGKHGNPIENIKMILIGNRDGLLRSTDNADNSFDEVFINLKKSFCEQNRIKIKDLKTSLKSVKRKISVMNDEEWAKKGIVADYVIDNHNYSDTDKYEMKDISLYGENIIRECRDNENKTAQKIYEAEHILAESFDRTDECAVKYVLCRIKHSEKSDKNNASGTDSDKSEYLNELYALRHSLTEKEMKKKLSGGDYIINENQMLQYAELLLNAGQYAKSFDVIRQYYTNDYDKSYVLLQNIMSKSKNNKLCEAVNRFVVDKEMKPNGFGEAMLEAIVDGIEDYFDSNPESVLKDREWL